MENEIWKDIEGWEGYYQVSNKARVRSLDRVIWCSDNKPQPWKGRILKLRTHHAGYYEVKFTKNSKSKIYKLHRLVAEAFIPNPDNKPQINHKNGVGTDNRLANLEWVSASENSLHAHAVLKREYKRMVDPKTKTFIGREVLKLSLNGDFICEYKSMKDASIDAKCSNTLMARVCYKNKTRTEVINGYLWKFKNEYINE